MKSAYPTAAEVTSFLASLQNVVLPAGFDVVGGLASAIEEWERLTEYRPFLSNGEVETIRFDPPGPRTARPHRGGGRRLRLGAGLVSIESVTVSGRTLVEGEDYWPSPDDGPRRKRPYDALEFRSVQWGEPRSIVVTGVWGFGLQIPDEAWGAVRDLAAGSALERIREGLKGGLVEIKDDEVSHRFSIEMLGSIGEDLVSRAARTALAYKLIA